MTRFLCDQVVMMVDHSETISVDTARLIVVLEMSVSKGADVGAEIKAACNTFLQGDWSITSIHESEHLGSVVVTAGASARFKQSDLIGVSKRAEDVKRVGMEIKISEIDRRPSNAQTLEAVKKCRKALYKKIGEELEMLSELPGDACAATELPYGDWRVGQINFNAVAAQNLRSTQFANTLVANSASYGKGMDPDEASSPLSTDHRVQLTAEVIFTRLAAAIQDGM